MKVVNSVTPVPSWDTFIGEIFLVKAKIQKKKAISKNFEIYLIGTPPIWSQKRKPNPVDFKSDWICGKKSGIPIARKKTPKIRKLKKKIEKNVKK